MYPVECVARGYLTGSGLLDYRAHRRGLRHRAARRAEDGSRLPEPIFTPATKAAVGDHDENVAYEAVVEAVGDDVAGRAARADAGGLRHAPRRRPRARHHPGRHQARVRRAAPTARSCSADEVLTPDSSRFWPADEWQPGRAQPSYDKQIVRDWLHSRRSPAGTAPPASRRRRCPTRSSSGPARGTSRPTSGSPARRSERLDGSVPRRLRRTAASVAFDYLADPRNRPEWQSSLLSVTPRRRRRRAARRADAGARRPMVGAPAATWRSPAGAVPDVWAECAARGTASTATLVLALRGRARSAAGMRGGPGGIVGSGGLLRYAAAAGRLAGRAAGGRLRVAGIVGRMLSTRGPARLGSRGPGTLVGWPTCRTSPLCSRTPPRRYPDREAVVLGDTRLTYAQVNGAANQVANLLVSRGIRAGRQGRARAARTCPTSRSSTSASSRPARPSCPLNVLLKGREVAYHLADSDAKAYFCFQGTAELPIGAEGHAGFEQTDGCEHFFVITADPAADSPIEGTETMGRAVAGAAADLRDASTADDDDTAVILYTSGTTGQPKGAELRHRNMRDNALAGDGLFGADAERPDTYLCVLPLFHSFGQTVIQNGALRLRRHRRHAAAVRGRGGAQGDGQGERHLLRRRADDVLGAARRARRHGRRRRRARRATSGSPRPAARRCRSRSTRSSRSGSASRSSRATACRRRRRWRASRSTASRCGSARSGCPIPGVEMKLLEPEQLGRGRADDRGRDRRDRDQGPQHHEGLLQPARRHRRGDPGRLVPLRRPGASATTTAGTTSSTGPRT